MCAAQAAVQPSKWHHHVDSNSCIGLVLLKGCQPSALAVAPCQNGPVIVQEAVRKMTSALSGRASQSQRECNDILTCPTPAGAHLHPPPQPADPHQSPWAPQHLQFADSTPRPRLNPQPDSTATPAAPVAAETPVGQLSRGLPRSLQRWDSIRRSQDVSFLQRAGGVRATPRPMPQRRLAHEGAADDEVGSQHGGDAEMEECLQDPDDFEQALQQQLNSDPRSGLVRDVEDGRLAGLGHRNLATGVFATPGTRPPVPRWGPLSQDLESVYQVSH